MNAHADEAKRLRIRDSSLSDEFSQSGRDESPGMPCLVARTTTISTYPSTAQSFFACSPMTVLGAEVEGGSGTVNPGSSTFLALNVGTVVPPMGVSILATFVDNRWVFRYDG